MISETTASLKIIDPNSIILEGYELSDQNVIPNENIITSFIPFEDVVEFWAYDVNKILVGGDNNLKNYDILPSPSLEGGSEITLTPIQNAIDGGYDTGELNVIYNFIRYQISSSLTSKYYLAEISSDRTEIRLKSNTIPNDNILTVGKEFQDQITLSDDKYFDEFYIGFGDNEYHIGVNLKVDTVLDVNSILIKLYDALPPEYSLKDEVVVVTKPAESVGYQLSFPSNEDLLLDVTYIQGPNINLEINDFVNNSTELKSKSELLSSPSKTSNDNLQNILNSKGVKITPNYSYDTFNEFINFSSAKKRIENFIEKVKLIETYQSDIEILNSITGPTSESFQVSSSLLSANTKIENLIKNFDGYEYYLYYSTGSSSYPKSTSTFPYELYPSTDVIVSTWLGSDVENSQYYGGIILSASLYDNNNQNWLYYIIPEFIRDNDDNNQYLEFSNMVGQHFDEIWLYTQNVAEKLNTTSDIFDGVPLDLAEEAIKSLGFKGYGSNVSNQDNYIGLIGENNGDYLPPTGSETITNYIAVNSGEIINYWGSNVSPLPAFPYALDQVNKEVFKRLYHNMSYLVKKKGTISGLRQLINVWGIPNTILRINEFGGKNKDDINDYDLWYNRYSYAYSPIANQSSPSSSVLFPWLPLERNRTVNNEFIVPDNIQFRFKTTGIPASGQYTQSLLIKNSKGSGDGFEDLDFGISLYYEPPTTGSYSGSYSDEYENWGTMRFYMSGSSLDGGVAVSDEIYLPFFDKGWWSVMLQRDKHTEYETYDEATTYTLYVKNKTYNGYDGNSIGFTGSASIISNISESINKAWNSIGTTGDDGVYLGGNITGSIVGGITLNGDGGVFSGSFQEFRYYSSPLSESIFNDFVMNPESIEGINFTGSLSSFDILNFRAPLGNELESLFTSSLSSSYTEQFTSLHPAISGASNLLVTSSFVSPEGKVTSSNYTVSYFENDDVKTFSEANTEVYFLDQPAIGVRNRISNKIQIEDTDDYGNILSSQISIQQDYQISRSYTEDINSLEVAFSPQDEVNDDIIQSFGYGSISDVIADPREISSSSNFYPGLRNLAEDYFKKYSKGNIYDYIRLIKYFDNSIFKAIKNYVPARTSVSTGIIIKQHLLERNRYNPPKITQNTQIAVGSKPSYNNPISLQNLEITTSISDLVRPNGGTGGTVEQFNYSGSPSFTQTLITQSWVNNIITPLGVSVENEDKQLEFYNGNYSGSAFSVTTQSLFDNPYKYQNVSPVEYNVTFSAMTGSGGNLIPPLDPSDPADTVPLATTEQINTHINEFGEIAENSAVIIYQNIEVKVLVEDFPPFNNVITYKGQFMGAIINSRPIGEDDKYLNETLLNPPSDLTIPIDSRFYNLDFTDLNSTTVKFRNKQFNFILNLANQNLYTTQENFTFLLPSRNNQPTQFVPFLVSEDGIDFENSEYFATPNNYNENRKNTFIYDLDFTQGGTTPQNRIGVISGSATKAQTPNSNYTTKRSIIPRYLGSKLSSANYNFFTPSGSITPASGSTPEGVLPHFLNGDTGSWDGDISFGKTPVINSNPIYIAKYSSEYQNPQVFNSRTFTLDSLIEIPRRDISGQSITPVTLKIDGNNDRLRDVVSVFDPKRKASFVSSNIPLPPIVYDSSSVIDPNLFTSGSLPLPPIDTTSNLNDILYSGINPQFIGGTQQTQFETATTMSFTQNQLIGDTTYMTVNDLRNITGSGSIPYMITSSGALILKGENKQLSFTDASQTPPNGLLTFYGPGLCLLHSLNVSTELGETTELDPLTLNLPIPSPFNPRIGYPVSSSWDPSNPSNYFNFDPNFELRMSNYKSSNLPFIIKRGDEIRISYIGSDAKLNATGSDFSDLKTKMFTVHGVEGGLPTDYSVGGTPFLQTYLTQPTQSYQNTTLTLSDRILVTPDPSTLDDPIPEGKIYSFTIIRQQEDETKVTIRVPNTTYASPSISNYINQTQVVDLPGYLIPNDLSPIQKQNVDIILNALRSQNSGVQ